MESTARLLGRPGTPRWHRLAVALVAMLVLGMATSPISAAQDATEAPETPDVVVPGTGDESEDVATPGAEEPATEEAETPEPAEEEEEPASTTSSSGMLEISATDTGNPAVLAQGLAFLTGDRSVWQVREVEPDAEGTGESSNAALVYQVAGSSVIRNDVTGKRALLAPGEAYFKAGGDTYTTIGNSDDSMIWIFEVVGPNDVADDAFYESPLIEDYDEGVFDMELIRYVLEPGESAEMPERTGPALVLSTNGDVDVESGGLGLLATGDGQLITEDATVTNNSGEPVEFVLAAFGDEVSDDSAEPGTAASATPGADDTSDGTTADETTTDETTTDETTTDETTTDDAATDDSAEEPAAGGSETSINITALTELYVVVVADGVTVFDGPIPEGGQSGVIVGTTFEVYTSHGAGTLFTNSCGEEFMMGYEEGDAQYYLEASSSSCAP